MKTITYCLFVALALSAVAADVKQGAANIALNDGRILKDARIVAIGQNDVSISHAGGLMGVPIEAVPLDVLARAHMAIEASAAEHKTIADGVAARQAKRDDEKAERLNDEIALRKAESLARERRTLANPQNFSNAPVTLNREQQLMALKAKFPKKERRSVPVVTNRTGNSNVIATATTQTNRGPLGSTSETTYRDPRNRLNVASDVIEVEVPRVDLYSNYQGWIRIATVQSLPKIIERIEESIERDMEELGKQQHSISNQSGSAQARMTQEWIQTKLHPYLAELKKLERR